VLFPEGTRKEGRVVETLNDGSDVHRGTHRGDRGARGIGVVIERCHWAPRFPRPAKIRIVIGAPIAPPVAEGPCLRARAITAKSEELRAALEAVYLESLKG